MVNWIDTSDLSFNCLLLLERVQLSWFPGWLPEDELALALAANPTVAWFMRHKCPPNAAWLDGLPEPPPGAADDPQAVYAAEQKVLQSINDLLVYALDPALYDAQPFLGWDSDELRSLVDFRGQIVLDIGSGTGRLAFVAAEAGAKAVYAVEPVGNLRLYLKEKAARLGLDNVYPVDGLLTTIPFHDGFAGVTMGGHVYGDFPEAEIAELERVTRPGGMVILCPGTNDQEDPNHQILVDHGYQWGRFLEPEDGWKRKYWKKL
jgi:SAM-dependent methyltransferase